MVETTVQIVNKTGLHARPASNLTNVAKKFKSRLTLIHDDKSGNAKSIINLLTLDLNMGSHVVVRAEGEDENEALAAVADFISSLTE